VLDVRIGGLPAQKLTVGGVYHDMRAFDTPILIGTDLYQQAVPAARQGAFTVYVKAASGADLTALKASLANLVKQYLVVSVETGEEYRSSVANGIDVLLAIVYVMLLFSVVIAVLGIVNTLALSVFERTREIGLLRAVGLTRRQLGNMITLEAITTALFGAVVGTVLGLGLGIALQHGLAGSGLNQLAIPWSTVLVLLVGAGIVGVLAAVLPAIRAVRLDVLRAIATE
jgi:putative ABC transport system permease protein